MIRRMLAQLLQRRLRHVLSKAVQPFIFLPEVTLISLLGYNERAALTMEQSLQELHLILGSPLQFKSMG